MNYEDRDLHRFQDREDNTGMFDDYCALCGCVIDNEEDITLVEGEKYCKECTLNQE